MTQPLSRDRSETVFEDYKGEYTPSRRSSRPTAACTAPTRRASRRARPHIDIPQFIRKIATGNVKGSARTIFDATSSA
jgi:dihydropyrimidine dehydrogenase (NAD+) subunit PreT